MSIQKVFILREARNLDALLAFLSQNWEAMAKVGKPLLLEIKEEKSKRSLAQNRRYFAGVLKAIETQAWVEGKQYSAETWHELAKRKFIGLVDLPGGGAYGQSSTDLSVSEFKAFSDRVEAWAATDLGVIFTEYEEGAA